MVGNLSVFPGENKWLEDSGKLQCKAVIELEFQLDFLKYNSSYKIRCFCDLKHMNCLHFTHTWSGDSLSSFMGHWTEPCSQAREDEERLQLPSARPGAWQMQEVLREYQLYRRVMSSQGGSPEKTRWPNAVVQLRFAVRRKPERLLLFKNSTSSFSILLSWKEQIHGQGRSVVLCSRVLSGRWALHPVGE